MKIAVISDIHGNIAALNAVLTDIARRNCEQIVNLGDCLSGPFDAVATADRLMALDIPTVRGNHDRLLYDRPASEMGNWEQWVIGDLRPDHLDWIRSFPLTHRIGEILLCHATPEKDDENWLDYRGPDHRIVARDLAEVQNRLTASNATLILCGHTHQPRVARLPDGPTIVNPGSVGCPGYRDTRVVPNVVHQTGAPDARYAIVETRDGHWCADHIAVPYYATEMIRMARTKGADHFAQAISTGWLA